jgi:branched-chain amino acid transport system substrate-binding protein
MKQLIISTAVAAVLLSPLTPASAEISGGVVRIGVLDDLSSVFADSNGPGSVVSAQMAVEDFGGKIGNATIEVVSADHLNKPDVGATIARQWFDRDGVDVIADLGNSAVALAVAALAREKDKVALISSAGSTALTGAQCSPNTVQWTYDNYALANTSAKAIVAAGEDTWYFVTADYAFGHDLEKLTSETVEASGGKVLGAVRHPLNTADFASFLLQAQGSGAKVIGFANGGQDTANALKQGREFKLKQRLVGLSATIVDVFALGLPTAQGLLIASPFYWDMNDGTRAWSKRWSERMHGHYPTMMQAGVYAAILHYLKAVAAAQTDSGKAVVDRMKAMPTDDPLFGKGSIRADGRKLHNMYLWQVKTPAESKYPWDYYKLVGTVPASEAFRPLAQSECPAVKKG